MEVRKELLQLNKLLVLPFVDSSVVGISRHCTFRAAINALQFACLKSDIGSCFDTVTSLASSTSSKGKKKKVCFRHFHSKIFFGLANGTETFSLKDPPPKT